MVPLGMVTKFFTLPLPNAQKRSCEHWDFGRIKLNDMSTPISPYKHLGDTRATVPFRVDPNDIAYLRSKYPYGMVGVVDTVCATLFHSFINELRKHEPFNPACFVNDQGYEILSTILANVFRVERRAVGISDTTEEARPRDGRRRADGIRKTVQRAAVERPEPTRKRESRPKTKNESGSEKE